MASPREPFDTTLHHAFLNEPSPLPRHILEDELTACPTCGDLPLYRDEVCLSCGFGRERLFSPVSTFSPPSSAVRAVDLMDVEPNHESPRDERPDRQGILTPWLMPGLTDTVDRPDINLVIPQASNIPDTADETYESPRARTQQEFVVADAGGGITNINRYRQLLPAVRDVIVEQLGPLPVMRPLARDPLEGPVQVRRRFSDVEKEVIRGKIACDACRIKKKRCPHANPATRVRTARLRASRGMATGPNETAAETSPCVRRPLLSTITEISRNCLGLSRYLNRFSSTSSTTSSPKRSFRELGGRGKIELFTKVLTWTYAQTSENEDQCLGKRHSLTLLPRTPLGHALQETPILVRHSQPFVKRLPPINFVSRGRGSAWTVLRSMLSMLGGRRTDLSFP